MFLKLQKRSRVYGATCSRSSVERVAVSVTALLSLSKSIELAPLSSPSDDIHPSSRRMKALVFTLVRAFEFELSFPADQVKKRSLVVTRPYMKNNLEAGAQMPLRVKLVQK